MKIKFKIAHAITWIKCKLIRCTAFIRNLQLRYFKYHSIEPISNLEKTTIRDLENNFETILSSNKFTVFDIFDIKRMVNKTISNQTEAIAYKAAFTAAKVLGISKKVILDSYYYYCGIVETVKAKHHEVIDTQKSQIEKAISEEISSLEESVEANKVKIQKLIKENETICMKVIALRDERATRVGKLLKLKDKVTSIYTETISDLKSQVDKCTKYSDNDNE